jgi:hypothetical protein
VKDVLRIRDALEWIYTDLTRPENVGVWTILHKLQPARTLVELFDMVWWSYFRQIELVKAVQSV